ncbi:hypothetical protein BO70DRAFT_398648 [Aspergillus heteromorphus CBS 117.55]|uniref:Actin-like ATPase domain-containing protein n=1 Tax=Aspergillus heteromorphus CBS 117.55 TaxID=1448321 RepID=A0A317VN08_9EURO|nr:uncharacterized protein BO70DRAFT_398648 [Aspergillus heteromorphus CBS 117.55]PWY74318.1 hypothetical protein BO70DRAFT_398648 [Aspergillus heteromorphus CBS 117.55]
MASPNRKVVVGIDYGTTKTCVCYGVQDDGSEPGDILIRSIYFENGVSTPSAISYSGGTVRWGKSAESAANHYKWTKLLLDNSYATDVAAFSVGNEAGNPHFRLLGNTTAARGGGATIDATLLEEVARHCQVHLGDLQPQIQGSNLLERVARLKIDFQGHGDQTLALPETIVPQFGPDAVEMTVQPQLLRGAIEEVVVEAVRLLMGQPGVDAHYILLVGGISQIPFLRERFRRALPDGMTIVVPRHYVYVRPSIVNADLGSNSKRRTELVAHGATLRGLLGPAIPTAVIRRHCGIISDTPGGVYDDGLLAVVPREGLKSRSSEEAGNLSLRIYHEEGSTRFKYIRFVQSDDRVAAASSECRIACDIEGVQLDRFFVHHLQGSRKFLLSFRIDWQITKDSEVQLTAYAVNDEYEHQVGANTVSIP